MAGGLSARLRAAREDAFVGRAAELSLYRRALDAEPGAPVVLHVHGPGGVGKSTLLQRFADEAETLGRPVVHLDARTLRLTPATFSQEASWVTTVCGSVLLVDTFECCQGLEDWLRETFLPRLADKAVVVLAGRQPLCSRWRTDPGWRQALQSLGLRNLTPEEAESMLVARTVPVEERAAIMAFARGHPLALALASDGSGSAFAAGARENPPHDVISALLARVVDDVPSPLHRQALEVCAHTRTTTQDLLRAALPIEDAAPLFDWLKRLPFVAAGNSGLYPHDVVRDALDHDLRWRDPDEFVAMHHRLRSHLLRQAATATGDAVLPAMDALKYLHRAGGITRRFFVFDDQAEAYEDRFTDADAPTVLRLAHKAEGPEAATAVEYWLRRQPEAFYVHRDPATGEAVAFLAWLTLEEPLSEDMEADPVVAEAWRYALHTKPVREGEHIVLARFIVYPGQYQRPSPVMDLMMHRVLAGFLHAKRRAWSFIVLEDTAFWEPLMSFSEHRLVPEAAMLGDRTWSLFGHDWRSAPVATWLDSTAEEELFGQDARRPPAESELIVLSRPEFDAEVRNLLRWWHRTHDLQRSPLIRSRLVDHRGPAPVEALRSVIREAVDLMADDPQERRYHQVLTTTYFDAVQSQERAAELLHLSFSTYRRYHTRGLELVSDRLWELEIAGSGA
ncbi:ATP-binding protein [Streptomyces sp. NPDC087844]|uniref:ATP-binding protein n=1 Tax=Streptomyces sp. NPDC087844 TaxID=3365805 RepID=UPI0038202AD5